MKRNMSEKSKRRKVPWKLRRDTESVPEEEEETTKTPTVEHFAHMRITSIMTYVNSLGVKHKRHILQVIRQECTHPGMFLPRFGISAGELAIGQVLTDRTRKK